MSDKKKQPEEDFSSYDDEKAIAYILSHLSEDDKKIIHKDDVQLILDLEYDFYESKGYFADDAPEDVDVDEDEEFDYISRKVEEQGLGKHLSGNVIDTILSINYDYCDETGIFEDEEDGDNSDSAKK